MSSVSINNGQHEVMEEDSESPLTNLENSEETPQSEDVPKAKSRGKKRKHGDVEPTRVTPRRATRGSRKSYAEEAFTGVEDEIPDDPDYRLDDDDDPDFAPVHPRAQSPVEESPTRKGRNRGKSKGNNRSGRRKSDPVAKADPEPESEITPTTATEEVNGDGKDEEKSEEITNETVTTGDGSAKSSVQKLSSAYNYAATRTRQNAAIRLPEGPNLTDEQLKQIESQFKSGDFVMAKKDVDVMDHPPIWRIDGKSLLQKFQAFEKDGKMLYRNISTYSGWTPQAKALYVPVKVNFVFQSRYDTVVELIGLKGAQDTDGQIEPAPAAAPEKPSPSPWIAKNKTYEISEELRMHMPSFEIYLQTLISQGLDNNFLREIYEEKDAYFVDRVQAIDDLTNERKEKILKMTSWNEKFQKSLDTWPCINTMTSTVSGTCQACSTNEAAKLSQFYGQPYDLKTLRSNDPSMDDLDSKNFETCDVCSELSELYNKVCHQKYDYYSQCKSTVTNMRVMQPNKTTTNVLRDLLANDEWITGLFRSMCTTWLKADNAYEEYQRKDGELKEGVKTTKQPMENEEEKKIEKQNIKENGEEEETEENGEEEKTEENGEEEKTEENEEEEKNEEKVEDENTEENEDKDEMEEETEENSAET